MRFVDQFSRVAFGLLSLMLMLLTAGLVLYSVSMLVRVFQDPTGDPGELLLRAVGYTVVSIAVFEVAKYLFEEEVLNPREMRDTPSEARHGLTKFISTIAIIVFLEALVTIFMTGTQENMEMMLYPTLLLLSGIALVVGLGLYQRLSATAEREVEKAESAASETASNDKRRPETPERNSATG